MFEIYHKLRAMLSKQARRWALGLLCLATLKAFVELVGIASLVPLMTLVADPERVLSSPLGSRAFEAGGFSSHQHFVIAVGAVCLLLLVGGNLFNLAVIWLLNRFVNQQQHEVGLKLLRSYLNRPYSYFLTRNSSGLARNVLSEVNQGVTSILTPAMDLVVRVIQVATIASLLFLWSPAIALGAVFFLGGTGLAIFAAIKGWVQHLGESRLVAQRELFRVVVEGLESIKDIKVLGRETSISERFVPPSSLLAKVSADAMAASLVPRFMIETLTFGGIICYLVFQVVHGIPLGQFLPTLTVYAFALYKMGPSIKEISNSLARIRYFRPALDLLYEDLYRQALTEENLKSPPDPLSFEQSLVLDGVDYLYPQVDKPALRSLSLQIEKNTTVGICGTTGAGKTTLVDIILGLLYPNHGEIRIDGQKLGDNNLLSWRALVGYVPQDIFLIDDTVKRNIALGFSEEEIDDELIVAAAKLANLDTFIESLPDKYNTIAGERGVRFSGGQKQRIGIARALYHNPSVLVFDEATSALDNATERSVMDAIHKLQNQKTIIIIAHRLTTIEECDQVFFLEDGQLSAHGKFRELIEKCEPFRRMALRTEPNHLTFPVEAN